jgi:hypothetical protein
LADFLERILENTRFVVRYWREYLYVFFWLFIVFPLALLFYPALIFSIIYLITKFDWVIMLAISSPIFMIPAIFGGLLLYRLRCTHQIIYGLVEILISIVALWFSIVAEAQSLMVKSIGIMAAIYIMIRGLDNVDKGIGAGEARAKFDRWFRHKEDPPSQ